MKKPVMRVEVYDAGDEYSAVIETGEEDIEAKGGDPIDAVKKVIKEFGRKALRAGIRKVLGQLQLDLGVNDKAVPKPAKGPKA